MSRRLLFREDDVTPRGVDTRQGENYDLEAWGVEGTERGVVILRMDLQFNFYGADDLPWHRYVGVNPGPDADEKLQIMHDLAGGQAGRAAARASVGNWTEDEKTEFVARYKELVRSAWSWKVPLRTDYRHVGYNEFQFEVRLEGSEGADWLDNYEVNVVKITQGFMTSSVDRRHDHVWLDSADLEARPGGTRPVSQQLTPLSPAQQRAQQRAQRAPTGQQLACVHEFGHMMGLPDEYPPNTSAWNNDRGSLMGRRSGTRVRPRHLTPIADWLSRKYRALLQSGPLPRSDLHELEFYAVGTPDDPAQGRWTIANAGIFENTTIR